MKSMTVPRNAPEPIADDEPEGIEIHIGHEHMQKLGIKTPPVAGTKVSLQAHGKVSASHTEQVGGKPRHHMRVMLTRGDLKPAEAADGKRADVRGDVEEAVDAVAKKDSGKSGRMAAEAKR